MTTDGSAAADGPHRLVLASTWVTFVGAVVLAAGTIALFAVRGSLIEISRAGSSAKRLSDAQLVSGIDRMLWSLLVIALLLGALQVWFTWLSRGGRRGFRSAATVVLVFVVLFVLLIGSVFLLAGAVLLIAGLVLQYLPAANAYFRSEVSVR
ncbi:MAG: hypothetical protein ACRDRN_18935 [Sciscionella sp.]